MDDDASQRSPGTDLVPHRGAQSLPRELTLATDLALGAGAGVARIALGVAAAGRGVARGGWRVASALPGARLAGRVAAAAARPLADDGARVRRRAVQRVQRTLEDVVPAIVELVDVDAVVRSLDADALLRRVDVDAVLA